MTLIAFRRGLVRLVKVPVVGDLGPPGERTAATLRRAIPSRSTLPVAGSSWSGRTQVSDSLATTGQDTLLTPHEGVARYFGETTADGRAVYMASNESPDLAAFARVKLNGGTTPGKIVVIRERTTAELEGVRLNDQGTMAALSRPLAFSFEPRYVMLRRHPL